MSFTINKALYVRGHCRAHFLAARFPKDRFATFLKKVANIQKTLAIVSAV